MKMKLECRARPVISHKNIFLHFSAFESNLVVFCNICITQRAEDMQMMAYSHGFLVSVLYLVFLLDIHSAVLKFVPGVL